MSCKSNSENRTSYLRHPENLIRKPIRSLKYLHIDPRYRSGGILGNIVIDPDKNDIKNFYYEVFGNDPECPTFDPERNFYDPGKFFLFFRMTEVGCSCKSNNENRESCRPPLLCYQEDPGFKSHFRSMTWTQPLEN